MPNSLLVERSGEPARTQTAGTLASLGSPLRAYECNVQGREWPQAIEAATRGRAKMQYWRGVREAWPEIPYTAVTCRVMGAMPPTRTQLAQAEADRFNEMHAVGDLLRYWTFLKEGEPTGTAPTCHPATVVCEGAVIWLKGVASCISLSHVEACR